MPLSTMDLSFLNSAGFGIIIGALSTFAATYFSNKHSNRQQLVAQEHERKLQREEQEFECKRTALMRAAEATAVHYLNLATALDKSIPEVTEGEIASEFSAAHTGLHLYADIETIEASSALTRQMGIVIFKVLKTRLPLEICDGEIASLNVEIANLKSIIQERQNEIEILLQDQAGNARWIAQGYSNKARLWEEISIHEKKIAQIGEERRTIKMAAMAEHMQNLTTVIPMMMNLLIAARRELRMTLDEARYSAGLDKNTNEAIQSVNDMLQFVQAAVKARNEKNSEASRQK